MNVTDGVPLPVLDGKNYMSWKLRMRCILQAKGLEDVVILKQAVASDTTEEEAKRTVSSSDKQKEIRARMLLTCALDEKHTGIIVSCTSASQIWERIELEYADREPINVEALLNEYYTYKMDTSKSVSEYTAHIESMVERLKGFGREMTEQAVVAKITSGLPPQYLGLQRAWDMTPPTFRSKSLLIANLKKEEKFLKESGSLGEALIARSTSGHKASQKKGYKEKVQEKKKKSKCAHCQKIGHWWKECKSRPKDWEPPTKDNKLKSEHLLHTEQARIALCASLNTKLDNFTWVLDSGASAHMTGHREWLSEYKSLTDHQPVKVGNGEYLFAVGKGTVEVVSNLSGKEFKLSLKNVFYVPNISDNLFSIGAATEMGVEFYFKQSKVEIVKGDEVIATGSKLTERLYKLTIKLSITANITRSARTIEEWHDVLGHADKKKLMQMAKDDVVSGMEIVANPPRPVGCTECQLGKATSSSHPDSTRQRASQVLERVHMDLVGPISPPSIGGAVYFLLLRDEFSGYMFVELLTHKSHVLARIKKFINDTAVQTQTRVKILRSDNGTEFKNQGMKVLCDKENIVQEFSAPRTPQQNGEAERANRTVIETARSMLQGTDLPLSLWAEAICTAVYVRNRVSNSRSRGNTPFELFTGKRPDLAHLIKFGQEVHVLDHNRGLSKFSAKTIEAYVVGYGSRVNTYRCFIPNTKDVMITSDVVPAAHTGRAPQQQGVTSRYVTFLIGNEPSARSEPDEQPPTAPITERQNQPASVDLPEVPEETARRQCTLDNPVSSSINYPNLLNVAPELVRALSEIRGRRTATSGDAQRADAPAADPSRQVSSSRSTAPPHRVTIEQQPVVPTRISSLPSSPRDSSQQSGIAGPAAAAPSKQLTSGIGQTAAKQTSAISSLSPRSVAQRLMPAFNNLIGGNTARPRREGVKSTYMKNLQVKLLSLEPSTFKEALSAIDSDEWQKSIDDELDAHRKNTTWDLVPRKPGTKEISAKWVFKRKLAPDGSIERYKARLVARGFSQIHGIDYNEVFSPVVRMDSIRLLFSLCAQLDLEYLQFDVATAFLNGSIEEELYLRPPEGLEAPDGYTCRLRKSLYGLRQAPRCWNTKFAGMLKTFNMKQTTSDPCVFVGEGPIYLAIYVDDGLIFARDKAMISQLMDYLTKNLDVKVVDSACFIGVEIARDREKRSVFLHQSAYIGRMLERFRMHESKGVATPLEVGHALHKKETLDQPVIESVRYAEAIGSLLYCALATRPDIAHALSVLSKYTGAPREAHYKGVKRVFRYLRATHNFGLLYEHTNKSALICYTDADWAGDHENRRSMSGMVTF